MEQEFDPRGAPRAFYTNRIQALQARLAVERAATERTEAELAWWRQGLALFGESAVDPAQPTLIDVSAREPDNGTSSNGSDDSASTPTRSDGRPSTKEAVLSVLRRSSSDTMRAQDVIAEMEAHGWMPGGQYATNQVRNKLRELVKSREVVKVGYGIYGLAERMPVDA